MKELKELKEIGKFRFYSSMKGADKKCLTVEGNAVKQANIILKTENEQEGQVFSVRIYDNKYCVIVTKEEQGLVLDVCGGKKVKGSRIIQYSYHGGDNQLFRLIEKDDGFVLEPKLGYVVDICGKNTNDGAPVILWNENGGDNQRFVLKLVKKDAIDLSTDDLGNAVAKGMESLQQGLNDILGGK